MTYDRVKMQVLKNKNKLEDKRSESANDKTEKGGKKERLKIRFRHEHL